MRFRDRVDDEHEYCPERVIEPCRCKAYDHSILEMSVLRLARTGDH